MAFTYDHRPDEFPVLRVPATRRRVVRGKGWPTGLVGMGVVEILLFFCGLGWLLQKRLQGLL